MQHRQPGVHRQRRVVLEKLGLLATLRCTCLSCLADHYQHWAATEQRPGINYIDPESYDAPALRRQLASAREDASADLLMVFVHW